MEIEVKKYIENLFDFAIYVAKEIFDDDWDTNNKDAFTEIACRKLAHLGIVKEEKEKYIFFDEKYT